MEERRKGLKLGRKWLKDQVTVQVLLSARYSSSKSRKSGLGQWLRCSTVIYSVPEDRIVMSLMET